MYLSFKAEKAMSSISVNENRDIDKFGRFWKIFRKKIGMGCRYFCTTRNAANLN